MTTSVTFYKATNKYERSWVIQILKFQCSTIVLKRNQTMLCSCVSMIVFHYIKLKILTTYNWDTRYFYLRSKAAILEKSRPAIFTRVLFAFLCLFAIKTVFLGGWGFFNYLFKKYLVSFFVQSIRWIFI